MKDMGADVIFAVDVGSVNDSTPQRYGDSLSGIPFSTKPNERCLGFLQSL
jgi:lysophospholipid hydrolase